jgi:RES domain-containing protein
MPFPPRASAIAEALQCAQTFSGRVVHRQVLAARRRRLWRPSTRPWRWNTDFPALYTSLDEAVAIAERIKLTRARRIRILVGRAEATIHRTLDLTDASMQALLEVTPEELIAEDYDVPQALGALLFRGGVTGLLVPAALEAVAHVYPSFEMVRRQHREIRKTPAGGTNLVIFTDNLTRDDGYLEQSRFACEIAGIPV